MTPDRHVRPFARDGRRARGRRRPRRAARRTRRLARRSSPTTARASAPGSRRCAPALPDDLRPRLRRQGQPDARGGAAPRAPRGHPRRRLGRRDGGRARHRQAPDGRHLRRPGQDRRRAAPGRRGRRPGRGRVGGRGRAGSPGSAPSSGLAAHRDPRQPRLRGQGVGDAHGRWPPAVRRRRRGGPGADGAHGGSRSPAGGVPRLRRLAEPPRRHPRPRPSSTPSTWCSSWPSGHRADPLRQPGWWLRHPLLREGRARGPRPRWGTTSRAWRRSGSAPCSGTCGWGSSSAASWSARPGSTSPASSTARSPAARPTSSSTVACTTSWPPRATSGR